MRVFWRPESSGIDYALEHLQQGKRVVLGIHADAYKVGAGFMCGGKQGVEEEACSRSNYFFSLQAASKQAEAAKMADAKGKLFHIPNDGLVVSPGVEFYCDGVQEGYAPLHRPVVMPAIMSFSAPEINMNDEEISGSAERAEQFLVKQYSQRFLLLLHEASVLEADVIVIPTPADVVKFNVARQAMMAVAPMLEHGVSMVIMTPS